MPISFIFIYAMSFVKILDLIGFVSEYMLILPSRLKAKIHFDESHVTACAANYSTFRQVYLAN